MINHLEAEATARKANAPDLWNRLWADKGQEEWRTEALNQVYTRIERQIPQGAYVLDLGGGMGALASRLRDTRKARCCVADHSYEATKHCLELGLEVFPLDLEKDPPTIGEGTIVVSTECLEHLSAEARTRIFATTAAAGGIAFFSVPNDRLGPDVEPQHTVKYNALSFLTELRTHFGRKVRVEVLGPYLLAVCGFEKPFTLSVTMPCRNEAADLEATLASFRGVADEIVIGIDPRTTDNTREIAEKYAEVIFTLEDPGHTAKGADPVHFSWIRNQCLDRCKGDWIFMTEGHERLVSGWEALLSLQYVPKHAVFAHVMRTGNGQQWPFPWLTRNDKRLRYTREKHNVLDFPDGCACVRMPQIRTLHDRAADREKQRAEQRRTQNRRALLDDWVVNENVNSLMYLGSELREHAPDKSIERFEEYLASNRAHNGPQRYHVRLMLSKMYTQRGMQIAEKEKDPEARRAACLKDFNEARRVLLGAVADDWSRIEHWLWLGDISTALERFDEALQFYLLASTRIGDPPFSMWWVDLASYSVTPCQRLAATYGELGRAEEALYWARKVLELLPDDAEGWAFDEARGNIKLLEDAIQHEHPEPEPDPGG